MSARWPKRLLIQIVEGYGLYLARDAAELEINAPTRTYRLVPLRRTNKRRTKKK